MSNDEFEDKYMHDGAKVVHRDKKVSRVLAAMLSIPALAMMFLGVWVPIINGSSPKPMPAAMVPAFAIFMFALATMYLFLAVGLAVLRIVVTEKAINVKYGLWGPTIPLESIQATRVIDYEWMKYGGWGIRRALDGSRAYVSGRGKVVEVKYTDEKGKLQTVVLGANDANVLCERIDKARTSEKKRVAAPEASRATKEMTPEEAQRQAEAEAETEAFLAEDSEKKSSAS